jgi:biotin carboxyl carrier protein
MKTMLNKAFLWLAAMLLLPLLAAGSANSASGFDEKGLFIQKGGIVDTTPGRGGWRAENGGNSTANYGYLEAKANILDPVAGSITFEVARNESSKQETLLALTEKGTGGNFLTLKLQWEPRYWNLRGGPRIFWDGDKFLGQYLPFEFGGIQWVHGAEIGNIARGGSFQLTFKWGPKPEDNQMLVNGQKLPMEAPEGFNFNDWIKRADKITIGAETGSRDGKPAYYNHMASILRSIKITGVAPQTVPAIIAESPWGGEVKVSWTASSSTDVKEYEIYRGEGKAPVVGGVPYKATGLLEITDTNVVPGVQYFYSVVAVDYQGMKSAPSEIVNVTATAGDGPRITEVSFTPGDRPVRTGDLLTFTIKGESGATAIADIEGLVKDLPLTEKGSTGLYTGTYTVALADIKAERGLYRVVGKLADDFGRSAFGGSELTVVSIADLGDVTAPAIASVENDAFSVAGFSGKLVAGDILTVTMSGESQGFASFKIDGVTEPVKMPEVQPGLYRGSYTIGFDDDGLGVVTTASLSDFAGNTAVLAGTQKFDIDTRVRMVVTASDPLLPADKASKTKVLVKAEDANGEPVAGHDLALTLSTTSEYTGVVGGGKIEDKFAAKDDVDDLEIRWGGVTDSFGEISANYTAGFAAKTALLLAKDLTTGDVGAGWLNTYVASTVSIQLIPRLARPGAQPAIKLSITPGWLTADGRSKARVKAWLGDGSGIPMVGERVTFSVAGANGTIRLLSGVTDNTGMAEAEYRAGTIAGFVTITAEAPDYAISRSGQIELRSDAPAKIALISSVLVLPADGTSTSDIIATVADINDNPNKKTPVLFSLLEGSGSVNPSEILTGDNGVAKATYTAGRTAGLAIVEARHTSRAPTEGELRRVYGTVFVPKLYDGQERDRIKVDEWLVDVGDEVVKGQPLARLAGDKGEFILTAPEKGVFERIVKHKRDRVELGDTVGYVEIDKTVWDENYK